MTNGQIVNLINEVHKGRKWDFKEPRMGLWFESTHDVKTLIRSIAQGHEIRLAPEKKVRPLRVDELNPVEVARLPGIGGAMLLFPESMNGESTIKLLIEDGIMRTIDGGRTWQPFTIEEEV